MGVLLIAYAALLIWGTFQGEKDPLQPFENLWDRPASESQTEAAFQTIHSLPALLQIQQQAVKQGQPLLLVFYADWCISCKHLEHEIFASQQVLNDFKDWKWVQADITVYNKENQLLLKKFDLIGPPAILFFDKYGNELTKFRVVGEIPLSQFLDIGNQLRQESELK